MTLRAALLSLCLASPALAEANAECIFQMDGQDVLAGPCIGSEREPTKAFAIASPDGAVTARVVSAGGGVGEAFWNGGRQGQGAEVLIGPVVLVGACWSGSKVKLCMTR